jgi:hypothetical protein
MSVIRDMGYKRRLNSFRYTGPEQLQMPNFTLSGDVVDIEEIPAEVFNTLWLKIVLKRKHAAHRAKMTRAMNAFEKRKRDEDATNQGHKRVCMEESVDVSLSTL